MAAFTAKDVMTLREQTGAGMMDCKRALVDADGDFERAAELLRERGSAKAAKRASKIAAEGIVYALVEGKTGVLLEINCESDFVAKGDKFHEIAAAVAKQILATKPASVEALLASSMNGKTVETYVQEQTAVIGEKLSVRRFTVYETNGIIETYIHMGGTMGVMLDFECADNAEARALAHDIALHTAFSKPSSFISRRASDMGVSKLVPPLRKVSAADSLSPMVYSPGQNKSVLNSPLLAKWTSAKLRPLPAAISNRVRATALPHAAGSPAVEIDSSRQQMMSPMPL